VISAEVYDAGSEPVQPVSGIPGMDELYWRDGDFEEELFQSRLYETNVICRAVSPLLTMRPWPDQLARKMWVDFTTRYAATEDDGLAFRLYRHDVLEDDCPPVPSDHADFVYSPDENADHAQSHVIKMDDWEAIQAAADYPPNWLRLPTGNELAGLKAPLALRWNDQAGIGYRLELRENSLFAPFDLRLGSEYYRVLDDNGDAVSPYEAEHLLDIREGGRYRLYLRPARWRYVATVVAHYTIITPFESWPIDETHTRAHYDRPPIYPKRHDVINTSQDASYPNYYGTLCCLDSGIDWQWSASRSAARLAIEVLDAQYWTLCEFKLFIGYEIPWVAVWRYPPQVGAIVAGLERIDSASGERSRVWIQQRLDVSDRYPQTVLGVFLTPRWTILEWT